MLRTQRASYLGSCRLFRQIAHVSVTTFQDHTATAFHFFILMKGLLSWNAGSPALEAGASAAAEAAAEAADDADEDSGGVLIVALASAAAQSDARADARVVRCRFVGLLSAIAPLPPPVSLARSLARPLFSGLHALHTLEQRPHGSGCATLRLPRPAAPQCAGIAPVTPQQLQQPHGRPLHRFESSRHRGAPYSRAPPNHH